MKKLISAVLIALALTACGTTATSNAVIDPSIVASKICQPNYGLPGCYSGGGE